MTKRTSAKYKLDRRMGENVFGRPKSPVNRREYGPGQHGQRRKGKLSDFGVQLRAKQKLKGYYGDITEKQFKRTYTEASAMKGDASQNLIGLLERRLDMVVYRAKFTPTIWAARQLVSHGHVRVNGVKCNIASRRVNVGDVVELGAKAQEMALVIEAQTPRRARRARLRRPRRQHQGDLHPRAQARRSALSGADGAEPRDRILFALTPRGQRAEDGRPGDACAALFMGSSEPRSILRASRRPNGRRWRHGDISRRPSDRDLPEGARRDKRASVADGAVEQLAHLGEQLRTGDRVAQLVIEARVGEEIDVFACAFSASNIICDWWNLTFVSRSPWTSRVGTRIASAFCSGDPSSCTARSR